MSRIGNSLDNREIEHWFCVAKNEELHHLKMDKITFLELELIIDEYVQYNNNETGLINT